MLALGWAPTLVAGSQAGLGSGPVAAQAPGRKAAPRAAPESGPLAGGPGQAPVDMSVSGSAAIAAPASGAGLGPVTAPASVALSPSAVALGALGRSVFVPASAPSAAPECLQVASAVESEAAPEPGSAGPGAGTQAALGLLATRAAVPVSGSAWALSSGPEDPPSPVIALGVPSLWASLN